MTPEPNHHLLHDLEKLADPTQVLRVLVAFDPRSGDNEPLRVAAWLARSTPVRIRVITTLVQPWGQPSLGKASKKYKQWLKEESAAVAQAVKAALEKQGVEQKSCAKKFSLLLAGANRAQLLADAAAKFQADILLLPPDQAASKNRIFAGSTADTLLHYSPVALGLNPRVVKLSKHGFTRVNFAYTDQTGSGKDPALMAAAALAHRAGVPLRILAFSPSDLVDSPMSGTLDVAKQLTSQWREKALGLLDVARDVTAEKFPTLDISTSVGSGDGWRGAVDSLKWKKGDLMVLGSQPMGAFARVFIGSTATELLPHLSVPVLVLPVSG